MITKIEALNYKCLRYISQSLQPFQLLIGPNASGKTTFLDVLAFLKDLIEEGLEPAVKRRAKQCQELVWQKRSDWFEFAVELEIADDLKRKLKEPYTRCRYEIRVGTDNKGVLSILDEKFWLTKVSQIHAEPQQQQQLFPTLPQQPSSIVTSRTKPGWRKIISKTEGGDYFRSETTDWNNTFRVGAQNSSLANVPEDRERFPVSLWALDMFTEAIQKLMLNSTSMRQPCRPDAPHNFLPDGSNLPIVIKELEQEHPKKFTAWLEHLQTVFGNLRTLEVVEQQVDRFQYLTASFDSFKVPSWSLSDGTLRLLALTLIAYLPPRNYYNIYLIDEPENGVHPTALEAIYQPLSSTYAYGGQVFLATHSPLLLKLAKPKEILCFALTPEGATDIIRGDSHPALKDWRGEVDLETLFASGVLG